MNGLIEILERAVQVTRIVPRTAPIEISISGIRLDADSGGIVRQRTG